MEGTSGAADLELLRGGSGEAALGPRRPRASRPQDHVGPKLSRLRGSQGARGVIVGGVPCPSLRTRSGCGSRSNCAVRHQTLPLVRPDHATGGVRADRVGAKLSSRAAAERRGHQRIVRLVRTPRQTRGAGWRKPAGPWPVRPRLVERDVPSGASAPGGACPGRKAWTDVGPPSPGSGGRHGGWLQPHPEVSSQSSASWARRVDEPGAGIGRSCGCAHGLKLVAEVDERHLVQVSHHAGQPSWEALGLAYRLRAHARSGRERVTEAGSRRQSRGYGGGLSMILCLR